MTSPDTLGLQVDLDVRRDGFRLQVALDVGTEVMVLFGPSGAGKSTTLDAIAGLIMPQAGEIVLDGTTLFRRARSSRTVNVSARERRVGYVFQDYALFPHLTALGNVAYPLWRQPGAEGRALSMLERMGLADLGHRHPRELSGGEQQRVAIARALAARPRALLLDEPFAALDLETRRRVRGEIRQLLHEVQIPVVLVTHDREESLAMGDRVAVIDQGRVVARGEPVAILGHPPRERVARLMGIENLLRLKVLEVNSAGGVTRCGARGFVLDVPLSEVQAGQEVTVGVRADDVLLASERPRGLSARNIIPGQVVSVQHSGATYEVLVDCRLPLVSHVTRQAVEELGVRPSSTVWVVVKTSSCFILQS